MQLRARAFAVQRTYENWVDEADSLAAAEDAWIAISKIVERNRTAGLAMGGRGMQGRRNE